MDGDGASSEAEDVWTRQDEPVLRWVLANPSTLSSRMSWTFSIRPDSPPSEIADDLSDRDVHESLFRLASHGLIDGNRQPTSGHEIWSRLRVTAHGLIVLGEWPDLDRIASATGIRRLLLHLADQAPEAERQPLQRAAGLVARMGGDAVRDALGELAADATRDAIT